MLTAMKAAFTDAVVSVAIAVDANTTVTVQGLRLNTTIARAIQKGGLSNNIDGGVWVPSAGLASYLQTLPGKVATITDATGATISGRLLPVRQQALGGLLNLAIGEADRVVQ